MAHELSRITRTVGRHTVKSSTMRAFMTVELSTNDRMLDHLYTAMQNGEFIQIGNYVLDRPKSGEYAITTVEAKPDTAVNRRESGHHDGCGSCHTKSGKSETKVTPPHSHTFQGMPWHCASQYWDITD